YVLRIWKRPVVSCFQISSSASSLKTRTRIGECMGIFFCRSSESSSGGSFFVALAGNGLLNSPRHVTGVNAAAKAAVSTSARNTVARIIAFPFNLKGHLLSQNRTLIDMETDFEQGWRVADRRPPAPRPRR